MLETFADVFAAAYGDMPRFRPPALVPAGLMCAGCVLGFGPVMRKRRVIHSPTHWATRCGRPGAKATCVSPAQW